jgi:A1 cistron-splicing factor AAR2
MSISISSINEINNNNNIDISLPPHITINKEFGYNNNNSNNNSSNIINKKQINNQDKASEKYENLKYDYNFRMSSGVLLLLGCPEFMQFGIDNSRWKIGPKFMGIKLIPLGPHYINYALKDEDYAIKQGFFIEVSKSKLVHIRKWDKELEEFVMIKEENEKSFSIGVCNLDFDAFLGNYPNDQYDNWSDLTNFINEEIINKIQPISKKYISASKEYDNDNFNLTTSNFNNNSNNNINYDLANNKINEKINLKNQHKNIQNENNTNDNDITITNNDFNDKDKDKDKKIDYQINDKGNDNGNGNGKGNDNVNNNGNHEKEIPKKKINNNENFAEIHETLKKNLNNLNADCLKSNLYFTDIPKNKTFLSSEKIEYSLITKNNIDKSFIFKELLFKEFNGNEENFLGEFQFSFITFFISEIYESFEQWKNLCLLFLNCNEIINTKSLFFYKFIQVLYNQLRQFPKDFFVDEITSNNFFRKSLENFIIYIKELDLNNSNSKLKKSIVYFEKFLNDFFEFFIKDENEKIIEKYLNLRNNDKNNNSNSDFDSGFNNLTCNKKDYIDDEDDELPVIVNEEEIMEIMNRNADLNFNENYNGNNNDENTQNNTELDAENDNDNEADVDVDADAEAEAEVDILMRNVQQEDEYEYMELDKF